MSNAIPPDVQRFIDARMATGKYATEGDVLRDALRLCSTRTKTSWQFKRPSTTGNKAMRDSRWMKRSTKYESALAKAVHYDVPGGTQRHARQDIWTTHAWIAKRAPLAADRWMDG
jgi:Arc/MetJ-type ribon-helix-helix transcriptional regulator